MKRLCLLGLLIGAVGAAAWGQPVPGVLPWRLEVHHPFPRLLQHWWRVQAQLRAGSTWFPSPASLRFPCTLSDVTWEPATRPAAAGALGFNGSTSTAACGTPTWLNNATAFTVVAWVRQETTNVQAGIWEYADHFSTHTALYTWDDGFIYFEVGSTGNYGAFAYTSLVSSKAWVHLASVFDGSAATDADRAKVYVNAQAQALTFTGTIPASLPDAGAAPLRLGSYALTDPIMDLKWNGHLDDIQIYPVALTAQQVQVVYQASRRGYEGVTIDELSVEVPSAPRTRRAVTTE
jgi:Concanavalin A-like lectin/glucanases superfamily